MKLDEFKALTARIMANPSDTAAMTDILLQLNDDYAQTTTDIDNLNTKIGEYEGQVKSLQQTNMNLFLKVANPVPQEVIEKKVDEKVTYEDLLNNWDKGAI